VAAVVEQIETKSLGWRVHWRRRPRPPTRNPR